MEDVFFPPEDFDTLYVVYDSTRECYVNIAKFKKDTFAPAYYRGFWDTTFQVSCNRLGVFCIRGRNLDLYAEYVRRTILRGIDYDSVCFHEYTRLAWDMGDNLFNEITAIFLETQYRQGIVDVEKFLSNLWFVPVVESTDNSVDAIDFCLAEPFDLA